MKTKIYYEGGDTDILRDSLEPQEHTGPWYPPKTFRKRGVIAIVTANPETGWIALSGYDYYILKNGHWLGVDFFGLIEFLRDQGYIDFGIGWKKIKDENGQWIPADIMDMYAYMEHSCPVLFGRWTTHNEFADILQKAEDDREFGQKNGYLRHERTLPK